MSQIGQLVIYALWVASSFGFIALVPAEIAVPFLSAYAMGSLMASLFTVPIYTSWRNKIFDLAVVSISILSIIGAFCGATAPAYWMAAVALNIADFSISQAGSPKAIIVSRLLIALCALVLIFDFSLALYFRLAICTAIIGWSMVYKQYSEPKSIRIDKNKFLLTALTCTLYFGPLIIIPYFANGHTKIVYIAYSITGSLILKMQDFAIKVRVASPGSMEVINSKLYYAICCISGIILFFVMSFINPWYCFITVPILILIAAIRIVNNVSWS